MPPDAAAPVLDLAAYAEISGRAWTGGDEALRRELTDRGVASDDWAATHAHWTNAIDDAIAGDRGELVLAFAARFDAARRTASSSVTLQAATSDATSDAGAPDLEPLAPVRHAVPSYLQAQAPVPAPPGVAPPPAPAARPPVAAAHPVALAAHTAPLDLERMRNMLVRGPIPFAGTTSPERLAELREEANASAIGGHDMAASTEETAMLVPSAELRAHIAATPFETPRPSTAGHSTSSPLDGATEALDPAEARDIGAAKPTPFAGSTSTERLEELRASAEVVARLAALGARTGPLPDADETAMHVPSAELREQLAALPFARAKPASLPDLSVDRYAAMAAEIEARGESAEVLGRYGITTPEELLGVRADQERRFSRDPALRARFEERRAHFLGFLRVNRR